MEDREYCRERELQLKAQWPKKLSGEKNIQEHTWRLSEKELSKQCA